MGKELKIGSFKVGDKVSFEQDGSEIEGIITSITERHVLIKPSMENARFYEDYRISLPRDEMMISHVKMKPLIHFEQNEDGSVSL